jgi:hypothetical protein
VENGERALRRALASGRPLEHARGRGGGAAEEQVAALGIERLGLEELPDGAEGEVALELAAARAQAGHALGGPLAGLPQQPALPDAGRPFDEQDAPAPVLHLVERALERRDLPLAVEERLHRRPILWAYRRSRPGTDKE